MLYMVRIGDIDSCIACAGMNSGVLLMRNTDWMRDLIQQMTHYGTHPMNMTREEVCTDLRELYSHAAQQPVMCTCYAAACLLAVQLVSDGCPFSLTVWLAAAASEGQPARV